jgi:hypothetical protein
MTVALKKITYPEAPPKYFERVKGVHWQRVDEFSAYCGIKTGYYKLVQTIKKHRPKCTSCGGFPTERDKETNDGRLSKWPKVITVKGKKKIVWDRLCSKCMLPDYTDDEWREIDMCFNEAMNSAECPLGELQGVNMEFPKFTREERDRIDQKMAEMGIAFDHTDQKNWMWAGAKK